MKSVLTELKIVFETIGFEIDEFAVVPAKYISALKIEGIKEVRYIKELVRGHQWPGVMWWARTPKDEPVVYKFKQAEIIYFQLDKESDGKIFTNTNVELFNRILDSNRDLCRIDLKYSDGTEELIQVDFDQEDYYSDDRGTQIKNLLQFHTLLTNGNLSVRIGEIRKDRY